MKKILVLASALIASVAYGQEATCRTSLMPAFPAQQATEACKKLNSAIATDVVIATTGKTLSLQEATAASKCMGSVTFNGTTAVTVTTSCVLTSSRVFLSPTSDPTGSTAAYCWANNIVTGVSFDVDCDQANDGTANWFIIKES